MLGLPGCWMLALSTTEAGSLRHTNSHYESQSATDMTQWGHTNFSVVWTGLMCQSLSQNIICRRSPLLFMLMMIWVMAEYRFCQHLFCQCFKVFVSRQFAFETGVHQWWTDWPSIAIAILPTTAHYICQTAAYCEVSSLTRHITVVLSQVCICKSKQKKKKI